MNKLGIFIKDTFLKITKSVSFISMLLSPLVIIAVIVGIGYFAGSTLADTADVDVAIISDDSTIMQIVEESDESINVVDSITTEEAAREELADEAIDGYLVANWEGDSLEATVTHGSDLDNHLPLMEQALSSRQTMLRAQELGINPEQIQSLNEPVNVENHIVSIDDGEIVEEDGIANAIEVGSAYFINIVIMMFIMFYAATVIEEVASEKGTRMMEVILSSTTATTHFFGKIIGVFLVMVVHILFYVILGVGAFMYFKDHEFVTSLVGDLDVGSIIADFLEFSSVFLIVGVVMFMFIAAFLGSLITKTEDINRAATPLSLIVVLGFYIGLFAMAQPENIVVVVSSFIPLLTPFVMPFRIATNTVSNFHVWLSIGGSVLFTIVLAYVSLIFYRANVLIYSDTNFVNTLKQSWALVRSENKASL
jgi:ABC-2 type transport system permease protein